MVSNLQQRSYLSSLPTEIYELIIGHLESRELKSLRSTGKKLHDLLTPLLFGQFVLYPHIRSFDVLVRAAQSPRIASCVQCIIYDTTYLSLTQFLQPARSRGPMRPRQGAPLNEQAFSLDQQTVVAGSPGADLIHVDCFKRAFAGLENLKCIRILDVGMCHGARSKHSQLVQYEDLPCFYTDLIDQTCGKELYDTLPGNSLAAKYCGGSYACEILSAAQELPRPLQRCDIYGTTWSQLFPIQRNDNQFPMADANLRSIRVLSIITYNNDLPSPQCLRDLQILLKSAQDLENLTLAFRHERDLDFRGLPLPGSGALLTISMQSLFKSFDVERISHTLPARLTWSSNIKCLSLSMLSCTPTEMKSVLDHCSSSLSRLTLSRFVLMPQVNERRRACLVALIRWMQRRLALKEIRFLGSLANGPMQNWKIDRTTDGRNTLCERVESFVVHGGDCPLDYVAIPPDHYDLHKPVWVPEIPKSVKHPEYKGDPSWRMEYDVDHCDESWFSSDGDNEEETTHANNNHVSSIALGNGSGMRRPIDTDKEREFIEQLLNESIF